MPQWMPDTTQAALPMGERPARFGPESGKRPGPRRRSCPWWTSSSGRGCSTSPPNTSTTAASTSVTSPGAGPGSEPPSVRRTGASQLTPQAAQANRSSPAHRPSAPEVTTPPVSSAPTLRGHRVCRSAPPCHLTWIVLRWRHLAVVIVAGRLRTSCELPADRRDPGQGLTGVACNVSPSDRRVGQGAPVRPTRQAGA